MKTMTCKQLGGACDEKFSATTFEELGLLSKKHAMAMFAQGDLPHLKAMEEMKGLMLDSAKLQFWVESKRDEFDSLPER